MPGILIADDAVFMRTVLKNIIDKAGFKVAGEAVNGIDAIEKYKELKPDIVTMNVIMPELDGIQALKSILNFDPDAKIIICTAMNQSHLKTKSLQAGAKDFIVKPFDTSRIIDSIKQNLDKEKQ